MGTNMLWVRAVDKAGNDPSGQYDFYLPGDPNRTPTLGDVTGDGVRMYWPWCGSGQQRGDAGRGLSGNADPT